MFGASLIALVVGGVGWILLAYGPTWWRRRISLNWPLVNAQFQQGGIDVVITGAKTGNRSLRLQIWFAYLIQNEEFHGTYTEIFSDLQEAEQMLNSLKSGPLFVRYNPHQPSTYFVDPYRDVRSRTGNAEADHSV